MGVSKNRGYPEIIHLTRVFHYKPSILGYPYFLETPIFIKGHCFGKRRKSRNLTITMSKGSYLFQTKVLGIHVTGVYPSIHGWFSNSLELLVKILHVL